MSELNLPLINELPGLLVTPERFGKLALRGFTTELDREYPDTPETKIVFGRFPEKAE